MNQNNQPLILNQKVIVNSTELTPFIDIDAGMGPNDQLNIFAIFCEIQEGGMVLNDDNIVGNTFSDIVDVYWPNRDQDFLALPLCCDPRPWEALNLEIWRGAKQLLRKNTVPLALFNNADFNDPEMEGNQDHQPAFCGRKTTKMLIFKEPLSFYPSEKFRIRVQNNNTATPTADTYSVVNISFLTEMVDKQATLALLKGEMDGLEDMG